MDSQMKIIELLDYKNNKVLELENLIYGAKKLDLQFIKLLHLYLKLFQVTIKEKLKI